MANKSRFLLLPTAKTDDLQSPTAVGLTRQTSGYEVGDISCWTPGHAFVIFYARHGEIISNLQEMGHIDSGVEILDGMESVDVAGPIEATIELLK